MASPHQPPPSPLPLPLPFHPSHPPPQNPPLLPSPSPPSSPLPNNSLPSPPSSPPQSNHAILQPQLPSNNHSPPSSPSPSHLAIILHSPNKHSNTQDQTPDTTNGSLTIGSLLATAELTVAKSSATAAATGSKRALLAPSPWKFKKDELRKLEFGLRVSELLLCVTSFSLLVSDNVPGWDGDSFLRYQEYRYLLSANVIVFLYSAFQFTSELHHIFTRRHFISHPMGYCFNLAMDQSMAYMLVSASSAATSQNYIWMSRFGGDNFTKLINASVSMSFLAFFCLAFSSVISAHYLFSSIS